MKTFIRPFGSIRVALLVGILAVTVASSAYLGIHSVAVSGKDGNPPAQLVVENTAINRDIKAPISFAPVFKKVGPSVVNIYSTLVVKERANPLFNDPFLRRFFGDQFGQAQPRERKAESLGSGVIVSPNGYILTANHVVDGAQQVKVSLGPNDQEYDAKVVGTDPPTDIAVLKIEAKQSLPAVTLTDSDKLEVGDVVLAVGNPFGVGKTLTLGIISGLGRGGFGISGYEDFIQTDAAINPGNSGGALVDAEGRLVGINTAILSRSGGFQGVGFAVPVNMARFVMDRLVTTGKVTRGYLGINIQPLSPALAREFNLPDESGGILVGGVAPNSAAAKAGLKAGDVITKLNGNPVTDPRNLQLQVAQVAPGTKVTVQVLRSEPGGQPVTKTLTATLDTLPQEALAALSGRNAPEEENDGLQSKDALDGVEVSDIDQAARQELKIPRSVHGALVTNVDPNSKAAAAGLREGDVIVEINRRTVSDADAAVALSEKVKGDRVLLRVWSRTGGGQGGTHYIVVESGQNQ